MNIRKLILEGYLNPSVNEKELIEVFFGIDVDFCLLSEYVLVLIGWNWKHKILFLFLKIYKKLKLNKILLSFHKH